MIKLASFLLVATFALPTFASDAAPKPAAAATASSAATAPNAPAAKTCDPACDSTSYCLKGQCVDNSVKAKAPEAAKPK